MSQVAFTLLPLTPVETILHLLMYAVFSTSPMPRALRQVKLAQFGSCRTDKRFWKWPECVLATRCKLQPQAALIATRDECRVTRARLFTFYLPIICSPSPSTQMCGCNCATAKSVASARNYSFCILIMGMIKPQGPSRVLVTVMRLVICPPFVLNYTAPTTGTLA